MRGITAVLLAAATAALLNRGVAQTPPAALTQAIADREVEVQRIATAASECACLPRL